MGRIQGSKEARNWIFPVIVASGITDNICKVLVYVSQADKMNRGRLVDPELLEIVCVSQIFMFGFFFLLSWWLTGIWGEEKYGWAKTEGE